MKQVLLALALLLGVSAPSFATRNFYIDCVSGNDASAGTAHGTAWRHAPGMHGATGTPAALTPIPDDRFIFKKGVTCPSTHFTWVWDEAWKGTSGHPIYLGVEAGYNSGDDSAKPIFDGEFNDVSSISGGHNILFYITDTANPHGQAYVTMDGIDFRRLQARKRSGDAFIVTGCTQHFRMTNLWVHDWDFDPADDPGVAFDTPTDSRDGFHGGIIGYYVAHQTPRCYVTGTRVINSEISNEEAKDRGWQQGTAVMDMICDGCYIHDVSTGLNKGIPINSHFKNINWPNSGCGVVGSNQTFSDCGSAEAAIGYLPAHDDTTYIQDGSEFADELSDGDGYLNIHDNFFEYIANSAAAIYLNGKCLKANVFNNIIIKVFVSNPLAWDGFDGDGPAQCGTLHIWNNTFEEESGNPIIGLQGRGTQILDLFDLRNNHLISNDQYPCDCNTAYHPETAILYPNYYNSVDNATFHPLFTSDGFTLADLFYPPSSAAPTVQTGDDLTADAPALMLLSYDQHHRGTCAAWDIGAYQLSDDTCAGNTYFVATDGNNGNNGSISGPFASIVHCLSVMMPGDTCNVRTGTYNGYIDCGRGVTCPLGTSWDSPITLQAYNGEVVTLTNTGSGKDCIMGFGNGDSHTPYYWIVKGFVLDGTGTVGTNVGGEHGDYVKFIDVEIKNAKASGLLQGGGNFWQMIRVHAHNNGGYLGVDGNMTQDHGLYLDGHGNYVEDGEYDHNTGSGIQFFHSAADDIDNNLADGAYFHDNNLDVNCGCANVELGNGSNNWIINSVVENNHNGGPGIQIDYRCGYLGSTCGAVNNTIVNHTGAAFSIATSDANPCDIYGVVLLNGPCTHVIIKNNIMYNNGQNIYNPNAADVTPGTNLTSNPSFTNAGASNFTLQEGSAAIGYGENLYSLLAALRADKVASPRINSGYWTVGAYNLAGAPTPTLDTLVPATGVQNTTFNVVISASSSNFVQDTTVADFGAGITVNSVTISTPTVATASITIASNATPGVRTVTVTTGSEVISSEGGFTITASPSTPAGTGLGKLFLH